LKKPAGIALDVPLRHEPDCRAIPACHLPQFDVAVVRVNSAESANHELSPTILKQLKAPAGTVIVSSATMPGTPGAYEFRYFVPPNKTLAASSNSILVVP
jgi:hypothetical protein